MPEDDRRNQIIKIEEPRRRGRASVREPRRSLEDAVESVLVVDHLELKNRRNCKMRGGRWMRKLFDGDEIQPQWVKSTSSSRDGWQGGLGGNRQWGLRLWRL